MFEIETDDEPIKTMWLAYDGSLWERESDAIERDMTVKPPSLVYFCPACQDWKYTEDAAKECCDF